MLEGKALIEDTDMPLKMQIHAMSSASQALDLYDVLEYKSIAAHIKKVTKYMGMDGSVWLDPTLVVFSLILKGVLYILHLKLSTFSSSKGLLLLDTWLKL